MVAGIRPSCTSLRQTARRRRRSRRRRPRPARRRRHRPRPARGPGSASAASRGLHQTGKARGVGAVLSGPGSAIRRIHPRSAPAQKLLPAPARTTARIRRRPAGAGLRSARRSRLVEGVVHSGRLSEGWRPGRRRPTSQQGAAHPAPHIRKTPNFGLRDRRVQRRRQRRAPARGACRPGRSRRRPRAARVA